MTSPPLLQISNTLSKQDVELLLKKGAYGALMDDDNAGDKFCEEDIEVKNVVSKCELLLSDDHHFAKKSFIQLNYPFTLFRLFNV